MAELPKHIAIIPDGNRRWAKEHNLPTIEGHRRGAQVAIDLVRYIKQCGVSTVTFWGFSSENWSRSKDEVEGLMTIGQFFFKGILKDAIKEKTRITHIGRKDRLPKKILKALQELEEKTKHFTESFLNIGVDYGGKDEVLRAIKKLDQKAIENLTEENFGNYLDTADQPHPNPDIIIRTSGEQRTSGLMIWQAAYAEYFFLEKYFPELSASDIDEVLKQYAARNRRFGS